MPFDILLRSYHNEYGDMSINNRSHDANSAGVLQRDLIPCPRVVFITTGTSVTVAGRRERAVPSDVVLP
jgi:hypothetical protein